MITPTIHVHRSHGKCCGAGRSLSGAGELGAVQLTVNRAGGLTLGHGARARARLALGGQGARWGRGLWCAECFDPPSTSAYKAYQRMRMRLLELDRNARTSPIAFRSVPVQRKGREHHVGTPSPTDRDHSLLSAPSSFLMLLHHCHH